ncbi:MAG: ribosome assembly cofactor RimP [Bacteroidota bacterium]
MITEKHIRKLAESELKGSDNFIVQILVKPGNQIKVFIDSDTEVNVNDCVKLSRFLESNLDRDTEDYELLVSSAGLDQAFSQERQYRKYLKRNVDIQPIEGACFTAVLTDISGHDIGFKRLIKKHKNKKAEEGPEQRLALSNIKETKPAIQFTK